MKSRKNLVSRRDFVRMSGTLVTGLAAGTAALTGIPRVHAAEDNTIKIALVGCGGRGGGAVRDAMRGGGPVKLHALADVFEEKVTSYAKLYSEAFGESGTVPKERQFTGFDAYKHAVDSLTPGKDLILLATPAAFRPTHVEYAVNKGVHVFMEKSFAVDIPGLKRIEAASKLADSKNLKLACGLMWRHNPPHEETVKRIQDGMIGEIMHMRTYRMEPAIRLVERRPGETELAHQIRNYHSFTWTNGSFFLDWCIHNVDILSWAKNEWPESAIGMGGRTFDTTPGQVFDHQHVEYFFKDGISMNGYARHMNGTPCFYTDYVLGTKGMAVILGGFKIMKNCSFGPDNEVVWKFEGKSSNPYQLEHQLLNDAIRNDKPYNEGHRAVKAGLTGIIGRMAFESGQHISVDKACESKIELFPNIDHVTWETPAPVQPDANGHYPYAIPGQTVTV
ncbi:MAG: Gfo/Idh/MocA family oxidoreductase [Planctomycetaceae bacterium]|jgi:predicted dehydrogenase|nr:Gfo/Idh/MocA family oxidoreductase [Planctomycetaceae bacterium]